MAIDILHSRGKSAAGLLDEYLSICNYLYEDKPVEYRRVMINILERLKQEQIKYPPDQRHIRSVPGLDTLDGLAGKIRHNDRFTLDNMRPLIDWCLKHGHPYLRLCALKVIAEHGGEAEAIHAAREILEVIFDDAPSNDEPWRSMAADSLDGGLPFADPAKRAIRRLDAAGKLKPWLEQTLSRAEENNNPTALRRYPIAFRLLLERVEGMRSLAFTTRALKLAEASQPEAESRTANAQHAWLLRRLNERIRKVKLARDEPIEENPWHQVVLEPVRFENQTPDLKWPVQYYLEPLSEGEDGRNLLITWSNRSAGSRVREGDRLTVTRSRREGGPLEVIAQAVMKQDLWLTRTYDGSPNGDPVRQMGNRVFMATRAGLLVIKDGQATIHRPDSGRSIKALEIVDGHVFVLTKRQALFEFHPDTHRFDPIATRESTVPRNVLDGKRRRVLYMLADPAHDWLYLLADTDASESSPSIWRMDPDTREMVHLSQQRVDWNAALYWYRDRVLLAPPRWQIDRAEGQMIASRFWPDDWPEAWQKNYQAVQRTARVGPFRYYPGLDGRNPALYVDGTEYKTNRLTHSGALWRDTDYGVWCAFRARLPDDSGPAVYRIVSKQDK